MIMSMRIIILPVFTRKENDVSQSLFYLKNAIEFNPEVRRWAKNDGDLKTLANLPEFKKLMERQEN